MHVQKIHDKQLFTVRSAVPSSASAERTRGCVVWQYVGVLLAIDIIVLLVWTGYDPLVHSISYESSAFNPSNQDIIIQKCACSSLL